MPVYRITTYWNQSTLGVSETWWTNGNVATTAISARIQNFVNLRAAMMFDNQEFVGFRIADLGTLENGFSQKRKSIYFIPGKQTLPGVTAPIIFPARGLQSIATGPLKPDQLRAAMQLRLIHSDGSQTIRYLAGIPDQVSNYEPASLDINVTPGYAISLNNFLAELATNWAIVARTTQTTDPYLPVTKALRQESSPSLFGVAVNAAGSPTPNIAVRDQVHLRDFLSRPRVPSVNGSKWQVDSINTTLLPGYLVYFLGASSAVDPSIIKKLGTIQRVRYRLAPIQLVQPVRVGIHKRGSPSPTPRGRRVTRPTLDP